MTGNVVNDMAVVTGSTTGDVAGNVEKVITVEDPLGGVTIGSSSSLGGVAIGDVVSGNAVVTGITIGVVTGIVFKSSSSSVG